MVATMADWSSAYFRSSRSLADRRSAAAVRPAAFVWSVMARCLNIVGNVIAIVADFLAKDGNANCTVREIFPMRRGILPKVALVVDDEALIRWSVSEGLTEAGWSVRQASNGAEARRLVRALDGEPFVIVLDLRLPDVSDLSLVRELRAARPDVPMIVMTAHGSADDASAVLASGVFSFVTKPFDVPELVALAIAAAVPDIQK